MAHGILFLRSGVYRQLDAAGDTQYILPMVQRDGRGVMLVSGIWSGAAADSFYRLCGPMGRNLLKAGCALDVCLRRVFPFHGELHGHVDTVSLAPTRWEAPAPAAGDAPDVHSNSANGGRAP